MRNCCWQCIQLIPHGGNLSGAYVTTRLCIWPAIHIEDYIAGQPEPPVVLGTTVFEHALSRTSGAPLGRTSATPSSPPASFKKQPGTGATDAASSGMQGACTAMPCFHFFSNLALLVQKLPQALQSSALLHFRSSACVHFSARLKCSGHIFMDSICIQTGKDTCHC